MKFAFSVFVALAIAVAAPAQAAVVNGAASETAASTAAGQLEGGITQNNTAQSAPVSHASDDAVKCFNPGAQTAPIYVMETFAQNFCKANAGKTLQSGQQGPTVMERFWVSTRRRYEYVKLTIGPGTSCSTVIEHASCIAEMEGILGACGDRGGLVQYPERCISYGMYPYNPI
ncbi:hypothetical protein C8R47DRAFT_69234 [Mycena vitilis]|nr:hypothetical protein C8R47DRAFT_69234 [Mycena vitilis]